jgi:signal transduction histidine kinase
MMFPSYIRLISLPTFAAGSLLLWTGFFFIAFYAYLSPTNPRRRGYLLFGFTSLSLAIFSFTSFVISSLEDTTAIFAWSRLHFLMVVPLTIFFLKFSVQHLGIENLYSRWVMPLITLAFVPFLYVDEWMLTHKLVTNSFEFFGMPVEVKQFALGPLAHPFFIWCFANAMYLGVFWIRHFFRKAEDMALLFSFVLFIAAAIHDTFIVLGVHQAPYFFEFGFCGFLIAMAFQLFSEYVDLNRQLTKKTEELEEVNEEMRFLVGAISHDFSAPLMSIEGFVDVLRETKPEDTRSIDRYLDRISANTNHVKALMTDLVAFLHIGRIEEKFQPIDIKQLLQEVLVILDLPALAPNAKIEVPDSWPSFNFSPIRLKQIFVNLFQNSIKYCDAEKLVIRVGGKKEKNGLSFCIEDNGAGIPEDLHEKVFEKFFRHSTNTLGTGLGLSIIKKIVENYQGKVWIDPSYREGTRICFFLPSHSEETHGSL